MRTALVWLTCAALALLGCATTSVRPTSPPQNSAPTVTGPLTGAGETWVAAGVGSHWNAKTASLGSHGEVVFAVADHVLLHELATGRDLRSFVIDRTRDERAQADRALYEEDTLTAISPDGSLIAAAAGQRVVVFGRDTAAALTTVRLESAPSRLAFSADGERLLALVVTGDSPPDYKRQRRLLVLDPRTGTVVSSQHFAILDVVHHLGDLVVVELSGAAPVKRFEVRDLQGGLVRTWSFSDFGLVAFTPDGRRAAVLGRDGALRVVEQGSPAGPSDERTLWSRQVERGASSLGFVANGSRLLVFRQHSGPGEVLRIDAATGEVESTRECACMGPPQFSPDGRWALGTGKAISCALEPSSPPSPPRCPEHEAISAISERAGRVLATRRWSYQAALAFEPRTGSPAPMPEPEQTRASCSGCPTAVTAGQELVLVDWDAPNRAVAVDSDGDLMWIYQRAEEPASRAVAARGDCVLLYEAERTRPTGWGEEVCLTSPGTLDGQILLSGDNHWALAVGMNDVLTLWNLERRELEQVFAPPPDATGVTILAALSDDGRWAFARLVEKRRGAVVAWKRGTIEPRWSYQVEAATVDFVALRPGREQLGVALTDGKVLLLDSLGHARQLVDLAPSLDHPTALHWLADGSALIVGTSRGAVLAFRP